MKNSENVGIIENSDDGNKSLWVKYIYSNFGNTTELT